MNAQAKPHPRGPFCQNLTRSQDFPAWLYLGGNRIGRELLEVGVLDFWLAWSDHVPPSSSIADPDSRLSFGQPVFYVRTKDYREHTFRPCQAPGPASSYYVRGAEEVRWV